MLRDRRTGYKKCLSSKWCDWCQLTMLVTPCIGANETTVFPKQQESTNTPDYIFNIPPRDKKCNAITILSILLPLPYTSLLPLSQERPIISLRDAEPQIGQVTIMIRSLVAGVLALFTLHSDTMLVYTMTKHSWGFSFIMIKILDPRG
ncbi:unnamed protein product [Choristocarpus tenellus]